MGGGKGNTTANRVAIIDIRAVLKTLITRNLLYEYDLFDPDSELYKELARKVHTRGHSVTLNLLEQEFRNKEAAILHDAYLRIQQAIQAHAKQHGIVLVLSADRSWPKADNLTQIKRATLRKVTWAETDITSEIIERLNRQCPSAKTPNRNRSEKSRRRLACG
jgi:hypothetical protein